MWTPLNVIVPIGISFNPVISPAVFDPRAVMLVKWKSRKMPTPHPVALYN